MLAAFGAAFGAEAVPLPGGEGRAWRAGGVVLKPTDDAAESSWRAGVLASVPESPIFRVARPTAATDGRWVVDGWEAWQAVSGAADVTRVADVLRVADAFHAAVAGQPRPAFLDRRDNPWSHGEALAFGERPIGPDTVLGPLLARLAAARRPTSPPSQVVHGDLLGNVLFDGLSRPVVIDWPVYWRPARWASAVVVVDAVVWYGGSPELLSCYAAEPDWPQMLIRALMFRIGTSDGLRRHGRPVSEDVAAYTPTVDAVLGRLDTHAGRVEQAPLDQ